MFKRILFLTSPDLLGTIESIIERKCLSVILKACFLKNDLENLEEDVTKQDVLISFGTGVIVPEKILEKLGAAYNIHAASPDYPGRDPHHFAIYDNVRQYGATLHIMTKKVDAGPIVGVELFDVPKDVAPMDLLTLANKAGLLLLERTLVNMLDSDARPMITLNNICWGKVKRTRRDFYNLCEITPDITLEEFEKRRKACFNSRYNNMHVKIHGYRFVLKDNDDV